MAVGLLIVTHEGIGRTLLDAAVTVFGRAPLAARAFAVPVDGDPQQAFERASRERAQVDSGDGVLVLCDLLGGTPANVAGRVAMQGRARLVGGINLPMLVRVFNYPDGSLDEMAKAALEGGRAGVCSRDDHD